MKAHWVALIAAATLVLGFVAGSLAGFALGLWAGQDSASAAPSAAEPVPQMTLEVFSDGCGVTRSEAAPGLQHSMLTWVFRDRDGFQVLARAAESETRYRYFNSGTSAVVLEAHNGTSYEKVSNEVTVTC